MRYLLVLVLLAGCTSQEEQNRRYTAAVHNRCEGYGFKQGTKEFSNCVMQVDLANRHAAQQRQIQLDREYNDIVWGR